MNIDTPTLNKPIQTADFQQNTAASNVQTTPQADDNKSFKDQLGQLGQLGAAKATDDKKTDKTDKNQATADASVQNNTAQPPQADSKKADETNINQKNAKDAQTKDKKDLSKADELDNPALQHLYELNAKIESISDLKNNTAAKSTTGVEKSSGKRFTDSLDDYKSIKMDKNDAQFFANLVKNENFAIQNPNGEKASINSDLTELKSEATQKSAQVSSVLMDALNESMKTNKPFRIDFDKDIAVIMKVDKDGKLTAEFIPGDKAVENYLRNNIPMLKQSFDEQNLPYNQLSYRRQPQDEKRQQNNNNQNNKENENE